MTVSDPTLPTLMYTHSVFRTSVPFLATEFIATAFYDPETGTVKVTGLADGEAILKVGFSVLSYVTCSSFALSLLYSVYPRACPRVVFPAGMIVAPLCLKHLCSCARVCVRTAVAPHPITGPYRTGFNRRHAYQLVRRPYSKVRPFLLPR